MIAASRLPLRNGQAGSRPASEGNRLELLFDAVVVDGQVAKVTDGARASEWHGPRLDLTGEDTLDPREHQRRAMRASGTAHGEAGQAENAVMKMHVFLVASTLLPPVGLAQAVSGDVAAGKVAFGACGACHQVGASARNAFGPQLNGIVGRRAGIEPDYRYSDATRKSQVIWSEPALAAFIKRPDPVVPGTKMRFSGWGYDDKKLADLVAYLRTFPSAR
ncbi:c-type cytochrome [Variovorax robiniae]|uniref:C-type cytochrome n=1 Tax=Variovorax robiniae TaxID=1836199 RepID=A0ABU8XI64_9BURK